MATKQPLIPSATFPSVTPNGSAENITNSTPDFFYDYELDGFSPPLEELIPVALVYGLTLTLGMTGNTLVIVVVSCYPSMKNITNTFLLSLASADLLLVCICIPVKFAAFFSFSWTFGEFLCKSVSYLQNVSALCSVFTLTAMSLERYYAIKHPMRAKYMCTVGRARKAIILLWFMSFVLALPILFQRIHKEVGERRPAYWCVKNWEARVYAQLYEVYMLCVVLIVPLLVMSFAYASICRELWVMTSLRSSMGTRGNRKTAGSEHHESFIDTNKTTSSRAVTNGSYGTTRGGKGGQQPSRYPVFRSTTPSSPCASLESGSPYRAPSERSPVIRAGLRKSKTPTEDDKTRRQVIKMLVAVIMIFVVCWMPILLSNVLTAFGVLHHLNYGYLKPMRQAFYLLAYANSCVNPLVYGFFSRHFRRTFRHAICRCLKGREYMRSMFLQRQNSYQTRSTHIGYSKAGSELELTTLEMNCGNCVASNV